MSVGKEELCSLSSEQATDLQFLRSWRKPSRLVFSSLCQILEEQPDIRARNLSQKRSAKRNLHSRQTSESPPTRSVPAKRFKIDDAPGAVSPSTIERHIEQPSLIESLPKSSVPVAQTSASAKRIVSVGSIAGPDDDSAGGTRVWASNEKASDVFANILLMHIIDDIWRDAITLDWVEGRNGPTVLSWHNSYFYFPHLSRTDVTLSEHKKQVLASPDNLFLLGPTEACRLKYLIRRRTPIFSGFINITFSRLRYDRRFPPHPLYFLFFVLTRPIDKKIFPRVRKGKTENESRNR